MLPEHPVPSRELEPKLAMPDVKSEKPADVDRKSKGCLASNCHQGIKTDSLAKDDGKPHDSVNMHSDDDGVSLGCVDCHGGNAQASSKEQAHVMPLYAEDWPKSGQNPVRSYSMLNNESPAFVRFVNPSDLRVAAVSCGSAGCHGPNPRNPIRFPGEVAVVRKSMMATGPMLWEAALYNNGAYPEKVGRFGESYSENGNPTRVETVPAPTPEDTRAHGVVPYLDPLARFEITQPGNVLRVFERGEDRLSIRGYGTKVRTDPVFQGLQRTRLLDPTLWFLGTNDHPGDYRSSGCAACHVIYANDRDPDHSAQYSTFGNSGHSASADTSIPKDVSGFPIKHRFTNSIPSSQCVVCHVHPGTTVTNSYFGTIWWDNETDGESFYPKTDKHPSADEEAVDLMANPEGANVKGNWSDPKFLQDSGDLDKGNKNALNPKLKNIQIADFHGHGWIYRYVWKHDQYGNLVDEQNRRIPDNRYKWGRAVKLQDIHSEDGLQCADCHFEGDAHGNGKLYDEVRGPIQVRCEDCHGTYSKLTNFVGTGNGASDLGINFMRINLSSAPLPPINPCPNLKENPRARVTPIDGNRFNVCTQDGVVKVTQQLTMDKKVMKLVPQLALIDDSVSKKTWNRTASYAHTIQIDNKTWGKIDQASEANFAHPLKDMACQTCHSSWVPSCFGCHLPMKANMRRPILHYNGDMTRNWTSYNFQTLRDDVFMIARDGVVTGNRISPARSSCAVLVSSYNPEREVSYGQQQTVSAEGFSGQSFSTTAPHTVRAKETKQCSDCHISKADNNNARMAQLLMQGTNFVNFIGRFCWVAEGTEGMQAVTVTERDEPQAVIGSHLHQLAYPDEYKAFVAKGSRLSDSFEHAAVIAPGWKGSSPELHGEVMSIQNRGEYLFTAQGRGGFVVYDIANLDNKGFSERFTSAPVSPLGQRTYVSTKYATAVLLPTTLLIDPQRTRRPENDEQEKPPLAAEYAFITDKYEGLIAVDVITLGNGNPRDNFFKRGPGFNPNGILNGAVGGTIAGNYAYVLCDRGVVVVDISNPEQMKFVSEVDAPHIVKPRAIAVQFRYAFVVDSQGLKVLDVTHLATPVPVAALTDPRLADARNIYVARTYAYVSAGTQGLAIIDVESPRHPSIERIYNAGGQINDLNDTKIGMTDASVFAYLADGKNGLRVVELISPNDVPTYQGFSPCPSPKLIATFATHGPALAIPKGLDRDRAVDESGNQLAVFGRRGARPLNLEEAQKLYLRDDGQVYCVSDLPTDPRGSNTKCGDDAEPQIADLSRTKGCSDAAEQQSANARATLQQ